MRRRGAHMLDAYHLVEQEMLERQEQLRIEEEGRLKEHIKQQKGIRFPQRTEADQPDLRRSNPPYRIVDAAVLPGPAAAPGSAEAVPSQVEAPAAIKRRGRPPKVR